MKKKFTQEQVDEAVRIAKETERLRTIEAQKASDRFMEQFRPPEPPKFVVAFGGTLPSLFLGMSATAKEGRFFNNGKDAAAFAIANHGHVFALGPELNADASVAL